jgi:ribosomal protein S18 acetylase RimI-like enzyme
MLDSTGMGYVFSSDKKILGLCVGSTKVSGLYKRLLLKKWWRFGWAAVPAILQRPTILFHLLDVFSRTHKSQTIDHCGTIMSIAVHPTCQGQGIGKELARAFLIEAGNRGLKFVNLTTDAVNNDAVNTFYQSLGFELQNTYETREGRKMNYYVIDLAREPQALPD